MENETTKSQRLIVGFVCLFFAVPIDYLTFLGLKRIFESGISSISSHWIIFLLIVSVAVFMTRAAYLLLRYPNGAPPGTLISQRTVFVFCVIAFIVCVIFLGYILFSMKTLSEAEGFLKVLSILIVSIPALAMTILKQYKNL